MANFTSATFGNYARKWLIATAIFELLLTAVFVGIAVAVPGARVGMILTASILGVVGLGLLIAGLRVGAGAASAERIEATGLPGQATITGLTQTGLLLNDNPQVGMDLSVAVPGRAGYAVHHKEFVPLILLNQVAVGATIPVKVDPADPNHIVVEWTATGQAPAAVGTAAPGTGTETIGAVATALQGTGLHAEKPFASAEQGGYTIAQLRQYLQANGMDGWATIDRIEDSGKTVGDDHLYTMVVTVHTEGKAPYQCPPSATMVPTSAVAKVALGASIPVKVARENPDLLMFEWDKL